MGNTRAKSRAWMLLSAVLLLSLLWGKSTLCANTTKAQTLSGGTWEQHGKKWKYLRKNGTYAADGFKIIKGKWYYFRSNATLVTGLKKLNGKYYYFAPTGKAGKIGRMKTGLVKIDGVYYYFNKKGKAGTKGARVSSQWRKVNGKNYYFRADGARSLAAMSESKFIKTVGKLARADMKRSGVLASVTIAQAILESGYGKSLLALEAKNLFGMKASLSGNTWKSSWSGETFVKQTQEYVGGRYVTVSAPFRSYATLAESVRDHSDYLTRAKNGSALRYKGIKGNKNYRSVIQIIKNGGYATSPTYVSTVVSIIKKYKLTKYDK